MKNKLKSFFLSVIISIFAIVGTFSSVIPAYADWSNFINGEKTYVYFSITEMLPNGRYIIIPAGINAKGCWQEEWLGGLVTYTNELDKLFQSATVHDIDSILFTIESLYPTAEYNNDSYTIDYLQGWTLQNPANRYTEGVSFVLTDYDIKDTISYGNVVIYAPGTNQIMRGISYCWDLHV